MINWPKDVGVGDWLAKDMSGAWWIFFGRTPPVYQPSLGMWLNVSTGEAFRVLKASEIRVLPNLIASKSLMQRPPEFQGDVEGFNTCKNSCECPEVLEAVEVLSEKIDSLLELVTEIAPEREFVNGDRVLVKGGIKDNHTGIVTDTSIENGVLVLLDGDIYGITFLTAMLQKL